MHGAYNIKLENFQNPQTAQSPTQPRVKQGTSQIQQLIRF